MCYFFICMAILDKCSTIQFNVQFNSICAVLMFTLVKVYVASNCCHYVIATVFVFWYLDSSNNPDCKAKYNPDDLIYPELTISKLRRAHWRNQNFCLGERGKVEKITDFLKLNFDLSNQELHLLAIIFTEIVKKLFIS